MHSYTEICDSKILQAEQHQHASLFLGQQINRRVKILLLYLVNTICVSIHCLNYLLFC